MSLPITVVDAFTEAAFAGNPAAVMILDGPRDDAWLQAVAAEMNLSETAFLTRRPDGRWGLRWFTPEVEVALCGHATLASAHTLWAAGLAEPDAAIRFETLSGELTAARRDGAIRLDFPALPASPDAGDVDIAGALGTPVLRAGITGQDDPRHRNLIAEIGDWRALRDLRPDMAAIAALPAGGVIVTAAGGPDGADFSSRYFAPADGIPEDPVTGSAHCTLGPWWRERAGRDAMTCRQLSRRGGTVLVRVAGDRVEIGGHAVTVWRGEWVAGAAG